MPPKKYTPKGTPMPVIITDCGRSQSKRPKDFSDCAVRALTAIMFPPQDRYFMYDGIWELLKANGRKWGQGFDVDRWLRYGAPGLNSLRSSYRLPPVWFQQTTYPSVKGQPRLTLADAPRLYPQGRCLVELGGHVLGMVEGKLYDDSEDTRHKRGRCLYSVWVMRGVHPQEKLWTCSLHKGTFSRTKGVLSAFDEGLALWEAQQRWPKDTYEWRWDIQPFEDKPMPSINGGRTRP